MRNAKTLIVALVAVLAFSAIAASAASATLPELLNASGKAFSFTCKEEAGGRGEYETKAKCEKAEGKQTAGGKWKRFGTNRFTSTSGPSYLEASSKKISCKADSNIGEITGAKTDLVKVTFTGCTALGGLYKCQNTATAGEITTTWLFSTLGYIKKAAPTEVGLSLAPETGTTFAAVTCTYEGLEEKIEVAEAKKASEKEHEAEAKGGDSIIGRITPINTPVTPPEKFSLSF